MSDEKAQQEPSMEDILASIRRILSEEEAEEKPAEPAPAPAAAAPPPPPPPAPEPEPEPVSMPQDDIDSMFESPPPAPPPLAEPEPEAEEDVLELTEDMVFGDPEPEPEPEFEPGPAFDASEFDPEPEPEPMPVITAASRVVSDIDNDMRFSAHEDEGEPLLSDRASNRGTSLLSDLAREIVRQRSIGIGNGIITLEDMVRELLRPVLKEWLDENLPYMIERIVKKEIEKMVNRAENL